MNKQKPRNLNLIFMSQESQNKKKIGIKMFQKMANNSINLTKNMNLMIYEND